MMMKLSLASRLLKSTKTSALSMYIHPMNRYLECAATGNMVCSLQKVDTSASCRTRCICMLSRFSLCIRALCRKNSQIW